MTHLSAASSPDLQHIIATERARLEPSNDYVGLPVPPFVPPGPPDTIDQIQSLAGLGELDITPFPRK